MLVVQQTEGNQDTVRNRLGYVPEGFLDRSGSQDLRLAQSRSIAKAADDQSCIVAEMKLEGPHSMIATTNQNGACERRSRRGCKQVLQAVNIHARIKCGRLGIDSGPI
jgi:hypothetical protein